MKKIARLVSLVFHPQFVFPVLIFLPFYKGEAPQDFLVVFGLSFIVPFIYFIHLYRTKQISDWDIQVRTQRYRLYAAGLIGIFIALLYTHWIASAWIFHEFLGFFLLAALVSAVNFFSKVSLHVLCITLLGIFLVSYFAWTWWIFTLVPLVAWSRFTLKRHQVFELVLGGALPFVVLLFN